MKTITSLLLAALTLISAGSLKAQTVTSREIERVSSTPAPAYDYLTGKRSPEREWFYGTGREKTSDLPTIAQGDRSNRDSMNDVVQQFLHHVGFNLGGSVAIISIAIVSGYLLGRNGIRR